MGMENKDKNKVKLNSIAEAFWLKDTFCLSLEQLMLFSVCLFCLLSHPHHSHLRVAMTTVL